MIAKGPPADGVCQRGLECSVTVAEQHAHAVGGAVGDGQIQLAVAVEIRGNDRTCAGAGGKLVGAPNVPSLRPSRTLAVPPVPSAVARSTFPSPLKSPAATPTAPLPAANIIWGRNVPRPVPSNTLTELVLKSAVATSSFPSPLKSPVTNELAWSPTREDDTAANSPR